jgi:hypothetical protein
VGGGRQETTIVSAKSEILKRMELYRVEDEGGGIGSWLTSTTCNEVFERLAEIDTHPLPGVQLNQLLVLSHEAPVSDGFFRYYWLTAPEMHPYRVRDLPHFKSAWDGSQAIQTLDHLAWGLHRLYVDGLLYYGNIRQAFRSLRNLSYQELEELFAAKQYDTEAIKRRGPPLPLKSIDKDKRYLISEMACKSYGANPQIQSDLLRALTHAFDAHDPSSGAAAATIRVLLEGYNPPEGTASRDQLIFSASEVLDHPVRSQAALTECYQRVATRFEEARKDARANTNYYLSMLTDLDVYVATSMRTPDHFVRMAETCASIFNDPRLKGMNLRYFDPTLSAADGHEDKGLIECLMVKCAKALVYCAADRDSFGKDAEAAMALSLGRPVIFYCHKGGRGSFFRDVHPLARLINFETGVAVGAMITEKLNDVAELLSRLFENRMVYQLERAPSGSLRLREQITGSVVRLQTADKLLTETFWNHYHQERARGPARRGDVARAPRQSAGGGSNRESVVRFPGKQAALALDNTTEALPVAARATTSENREESDLSAADRRRPSVAQPVGDFPLTIGEVFDGIAKSKRSQATGAKRYDVFRKWLESEKLDIREGVKLLRFIDATLESHKVRPGETYTPADLTRWYQEMSEGDAIGSWR